MKDIWTIFETEKKKEIPKEKKLMINYKLNYYRY